MFKKLLALIICALLFSALILPVSAKITAPVVPPSLSAQSAVLIEARDGEILCEKNAHTKMAMASTTKIMTALVAAESGKLQRVVSVNAAAVGVEGSSIYLYAGEKMTLCDLIAAMLLESANDAAAAIAIEVGGSIDGFCDMMNKKAKELGLKSTNFKNPHGLYDEEHYTTAYELALIAREALKNEVIRKTVATKKLIIEPVEGSARALYNHNKLLSMYEGAIGVKTGFTKKSGRCLVGSAVRDGLELISVTLNAPDDWNDHKKLFDLGFSGFTALQLAKKGDVCHVQEVMGGTEETVSLLYGDDVFVTVKKGDENRIEKTVETLCRYEFAPVVKGKTVGTVYFTVDGEVLSEVSLITASDVKRAKVSNGIFAKILTLFK